MKVFDYGQWTITFNVNDVSKDYIIIYKGHFTPSYRDLERLGGSIYKIDNGKTVQKYTSKFDCPDYVYYAGPYGFDPRPSTVGYTDLEAQTIFATATDWDMIL